MHVYSALPSEKQLGASYLNVTLLHTPARITSSATAAREAVEKEEKWLGCYLPQCSVSYDQRLRSSEHNVSGLQRRQGDWVKREAPKESQEFLGYRLRG